MKNNIINKALRQQKRRERKKILSESFEELIYVRERISAWQILLKLHIEKEETEDE